MATPGLGRLVGHLLRAAAMVLAVGQQHQHPVLPVLGIEGLEGGLDGAGDVRARGRDQIGSQHVQEDLEGAVVQGERALQEGLAGEGHQGHAIPGQAIHELADFLLGAGHAVGLDVLGVHGQGHVHGHHHVQALAAHQFHLGAELRARQGQHGEDGHQQQQERP